MEDSIVQIISSYGHLAVFGLLMLSGVGLALGEDLIIVAAGVLVGNGTLPYWPTLAAAYLGVVLSDVAWFTICSSFGTRLLHRRWIKRLVHPRRLLEAKHQMDRRGAWIVVLARFVPGSRTTTITVAGMLHMPFWKFALATASCVALTAPLQLGAGMLIALGLGTQDAADLVTWIVATLAAVVALTVAARAFLHHRARRRRPPRARASWLRRFRLPRRRRSPLAGG